MSEELMAEKHRLCSLKMRVTRDVVVPRVLCPVCYENFDQLLARAPPIDNTQPSAKMQPKRRRHLVVSASAGVNLRAEFTRFKLGEAAFDGSVHVLVAFVKDERTI